jgi:glycosyltransferase involved in cell wall biosynthesis
LKHTTNILFVGNFLKTGEGYASVSSEIAHQLSVRGYTVYLVSKIANRFFRLADMLVQTLLKARRINIAIMDIFSGNSFLWAALIGNLLHFLQKPFILILRGGNLPQYAETHPANVSSLFKKARFVVSPSFYLYEYMTKYRKYIISIPNSLGIKQYDFVKRNQPQAKLIWLRSFHKIYNAPLAIQVVKRLASEFPEMALTMVGADKGDGSFQETVKLARNLEVESQVSFPGAVSKGQVAEWLQKGDIFINTTNIDNTPVSVIEAMACGLCVVTTNVGGIPYLLEDEKDALLVPPDDAEAMAVAIRRVLTEPALAERLSTNARKKAEQFDWDNILPQWEKLLDTTLQR